MKYTTEWFIKKAREVHGDKYDYSKVEYVNNHTKVCIICPIHGEFWQTPSEHLRKCGCKKCSKNYSYTTEEYVTNAISIHGNKYDYSKLKYVNSKTKVCIICPIHGEFWQTPHGHLLGHGCPKCGKEDMKKKTRRTQEETIKQFHKVHGDKYIYDKIIYTNNNTKVCIICPIHGEFWQTPHGHLNGQGCPKCANKKNGELLRKPIGVFKKEAEELYANKYILTKVDYVNKDTKICVICPSHGEFYITPRNFLNGHSCPKCYDERRNSTMHSTKEQFIEKARKIHGNKYDYSKVEYINAKTKVCIICPIHGEFWQTPNDHLMGHGCPKCGNQESRAENELFKFLCDNTNILFQQRTKQIIKPLEIDIYTDDFKIGIEFDGLTWHSERFAKDKYNLYQKTKKCFKENIKLIHILENQWVYKKNIILSRLSKLFNISKNYIELDEKDCYIQEIDKKDVINDFIKNNSLCNSKCGNINICLMYENNICACLCLKHYKNYWKILSYVENINYKIKNSFNILLDTFKRKYSYQKITVCVDKLWMTDIDFYLKNGFLFEANIKPECFYTNGKDKLLTKKEYISTGDNKTYYKIYDCGKMVLSLINEDYIDENVFI